jgi:hypothetical protein
LPLPALLAVPASPQFSPERVQPRDEPRCRQRTGETQRLSAAVVLALERWHVEGGKIAPP